MKIPIDGLNPLELSRNVNKEYEIKVEVANIEAYVSKSLSE